jgi:hypothetical protein
LERILTFDGRGSKAPREIELLRLPSDCDIPSVEVGTVILVIFVTLVAAMVQTVAGFGFSLLAVPALAIFMEPAQAVPLSAMLSFVNANRVAQQTRGETPWRLVLLLLVGSLFGLPLGLQVLLYLSPDLLRFLVGTVSALMALAIAVGFRWPHSDRASFLTGFVSGILSTSTAINGPPIVLYLQAAGLRAEVFRGALSNLFVLNGIFALGSFLIAGLIGYDSLKLLLLGLPFLFVGHWCGERLLNLLDAERFRSFVLLLLGMASTAIAIAALLRVVPFW